MKNKNKFNITDHDMLHDYILVKAIVPQTAKTGLIDPAQYEDKSEWGEVISVGPGRYEYGELVPMTVEVGNTVLYGKYSSYKIRVDGIDLLIIREDDVMSRYED